MKINSFPGWLSVLLLACLPGCGKGPLEAGSGRARAPKYKIDGSFEDWSRYKTGWTETGEEGFGHFGNDIDVKEFYYDNDDTYLYLFFKCMPTIQERYEKTRTSGIFVYLCLDSDSDRSTGATKTDSSGNSAMLGADIQIWVPIGVYVAYSISQGKEGGCYVSYEVKRWDPSSEGFTIEVRNESSTRKDPRIAHGKDGVEIALLLSDLRKVKNDKFDLVCLEWAHNEPIHANRISIEIE